MSEVRRPRVSVIIPAYRAERTLPRVLQMLRPQVTADVEVLVVESSGSAQATDLERAWPWVRVIGLPGRAWPGAARNLGVRAAFGSRLAFLDADALPGPHWLARLEAGLHQRGAVAVAGAVHNGTPDKPIGTSAYLLEFSEVMPGRRGRLRHGVSCNLLVERNAYEAAGGFCEDVWPGEDTILTVPWARSQRLQFAADAPVWHLNRTGLGELVRHQYRLGRSFVEVCDRVEVPYGQFGRWPLLSLAPAARFAALGLRLSRQRSFRRRGVELSPVLALGLSAWGAGVAAGRRELKVHGPGSRP